MNKRTINSGQILLYIILVMLGVFFGVGFYFLWSGIVNPDLGTIPMGLIGLGLFVFGLGLVVVMQASLMKKPEDKFWHTFSLYYAESSAKDGQSSGGKSKPRMQVEVRLSIDGWKGLCQMALFGEGISWTAPSCGVAKLKYADITSMVVEKTKIVLTGAYDGAYSSIDGTITVVSPTVLQSKALVTEMCRNAEQLGITLLKDEDV